MSARPAPVQLQVHRALGGLGPEWDALFAAGAGLQTSREWFSASAEAALPPDAEPRFLAATGADGPVALLAMRVAPCGRLQSLTTPYTCLYQPLVRPGAGPDLLRAAALAFGQYCRRWPVTRLEALDPEWPGLPHLRAGFARAGLVTRSFNHFGNWYGPVPGGSWDAYLETRPGALRETIRRKTKAVERAAGVRVEIVGSGPALGEALAAYESVYARSWKEPEPYPQFNGTLVRALAATGALRIGLMWAADRPIAAQYWTVVGGTGTVLKLAHDEAFKALSPGTVLTAAVIRSLIEQDSVGCLDFGRGDDPYKRGWTGQRRLRIGLLALNPARLDGLHDLVRHDAGHFLRTAKSWWGKLGRTPQ